MPDRMKPTDAATVMMHLIAGASVSHIIRAAAELGLADQFGGGEMDAVSLALASGSHAPSLARLLRTLAAIGIVRETAERRYTLTSLGAVLRSDEPGSMRAWARFYMNEESDRPWRSLAHAVSTGDNAFHRAFGTDAWTFRSTHPEYSALFDEAMQSFTLSVNQTVAAHYPFDGVRWVVDVGGGNGALLLAILQQNTDLSGTVFELPHVAEAAKRHISAAGLESRCEVIAGDALAGVPAGADIYILKSVIHGREDAAALTILRHCRQAMMAQGKLLLIERVLPERIDPDDPGTRSSFISDLNMMLIPGGLERTETEYRHLLSDAGLRLRRIVHTPGPSRIIEADAV